MRLFRRLLGWASDRLRCLAHRLDRLSDWTCGKQDVWAMARMIQGEAAKRFGVAISDEAIDLIFRFHEAASRLKDRHPAFADDYLISKLSGVLPLEIRRRVVEELEREVGIEAAPTTTEDSQP